jgi:glucose/arabinose dehydrogenase
MTARPEGVTSGGWQGVRTVAWALTVAGTLASNSPSPRAQTGDQTPPAVVARTPATGAVGVAVQTTVAVVFSEPVQPATVVLELRNASNQLVAAQLTYDAPTQTATLEPDAALVGSQQYTATARSARDLAGNVMAQITWSFSTSSAGFVDVTLPQTGLVDPMVIAFANDGRMFVAEKGGRILVFDDIDDPSGTVVADLRVSVYNFWDRGMMGMALHPSFPATPYVYVLYAYDAVPGGTAPRWGSPSTPQVGDPCPTPPGATTNGCVVTGRISRLDIGNAAAWPLNHTHELPLVTDWFQQFPSHSVGTLAFGPDGALYASGGDGASFNYVDSGQTSSSPSVNASGNHDPAQEGGALRSQDLRTSGDLVTLDGSVIRVDPDTGLALPDNPLFATQSDPNGRRIVSYGYRNPFRFTFRPGTRELWVGDVGWSTFEEINRIVDPTDAAVDNMGWPCYEGNAQHSGYAPSGICQGLYGQGAGAVVAPYFSYRHGQVVVSGETCGTGSSSVAGLAFYTGSGYPAAYQDALFFADYSRKCVWAMRKGANGLPDTSTVQTIIGAAGPVMLTTAPDGDVLYAGFDDDRLHRIRYVGGNLPPAATIAATPSSGTSPLNVSFTAAGSSDPEGQTLTFAWDLDGDGSFDDGTGLTRTWTYTGGAATTVTARVLVTDPGGQSAVAATAILLNGTRPTAVIDTPSGALRWKVGDPIGFSGRGLDPDEPGGQLPAAALQWEAIIHHCPSDCHVHAMQSFNGVASGSFNAPDHEYPSFLELRLTVTDPTGETASASVSIQPQTTTLGVAANVSGLQLVVNGSSQPAPFSRTVIVGSSNSLQAPSPQTLGGTSYAFGSWSDGQAQTHNVIAAATPTTFTATYATNPAVTQTATFQVAAGADDVYEEGASFQPDDLEAWLGNGPPGVASLTALRFPGVTIPQGAEVVSARLEVNAAATQWNQLAFEIAAEAAANSTPFGAASLPSQRQLLPARAVHSSDEQWLANSWYAVSTDLAPMLQQLVGQPGWASGNAASLIVRGQGSAWARKRIAAFETAPARAARMVVTYRAAPAGPTLSIGDVTIAEGNSGTANAVFTVTLSAQPGATPVTVSYATSNGTAVAPGDFSARAGSLTFSGATTAQTVSVPIVGDTTVEPNESFTMTLSNPVGATLLDGSATGTITNDDAAPIPTLSIGDVTIAEGNSGTTNAVITVTLSAQPGATPVTVTYATANGTAVAPGDFTVTTGSLTFSGTTTVQTVPVPIVGDTAVEPIETFTVTLSSPVGATLLDGTATGTITNDDAVPLPTLAIGDVTIAEGNSGTTNAVFTVTLSAQPGASTVTVNYSTSNGTAVAPGDFTAVTNASLTFTGTTTSRTIPIAIVGDTTVEATEAFTVTLSSPVGATLLDGTATGTITNDDGVPVEQTATFQIAAGADDVQEESTSFSATDSAMFVGNGQLPGPHFAGLRFTGITIPPGAVIVSARLEVTPAATQWNQLLYEAAAEAAAASAPFSTASRPSQRTLLAPRVLHVTDIQWVNNSWQPLAGELAPLLQGVINQTGWASGNPLSLILRGNGSAWSRKRFTTAEGTAGRAPRLVVTYRAVP